MKLKRSSEIPLFMSCSSFDYPDLEFILYTGEPKLLFEVVQEEPDTEMYRYVEHEDGDSDYVVLADCFDLDFFQDNSDEEITDHLSDIMDDLEEWYLAEIADLNNYDD